MCCFSRPIKHVSKTEIFARARSGTDREQFLVYKMSVTLDEELAMILPLPVPPGCADDAVWFIDLSGYDDLFTDLGRGFPQLVSYPKSRSLSRAPVPEQPKLRVHTVGAFEASFVPSPGDFGRLDERFRLPSDTWERLPAYADYGFAVFKLRRPGGLGGLLRRLRTKTQSFHPMALCFPRRDPRALFFPTVHIHDGAVHEEARFDHSLYCQLDAGGVAPRGWERSERALSTFADARKSRGILDGDARCFRLVLEGTQRNQDTFVYADGH
jgi:hypothetical protein